MSIPRVNPPGWGVGDKLTSAQENQLDINVTYALDKRAGQTDTLGSLVTLTGIGRIIQQAATAPDADHTYQADGGNLSILVPGTLTASRSYTLSNTNATAGDELVVFFDPAALGSFNVLVKDNGAATLAELGPTGEAYWGEFKFISGSWKLKRLGSRVDLTIESPGCRLSVDNADAYSRAPISDAVAAGAVGLLPYDHERIPLWNGAHWVSRKIPAFATNKITLAGLTSGKNYDVFAYWDSATSSVKLELSAAWTNDTTRADALCVSPASGNWKGLITKDSDPTRLYVGTFRTTSTTTTEDSKSKRFVWSMYNRLRRPMTAHEATDTASWTYAGASWRAANGNAANKVEFVIGFGGETVEAEVQAHGNATVTGNSLGVAIGLDSNAPVADGVWHGVFTNGVGSSSMLLRGVYRGFPTAGYHDLRWLEFASATPTNTFYGTPGGGSTVHKSGLVASLNG